MSATNDGEGDLNPTEAVTKSKAKSKTKKRRNRKGNSENRKEEIYVKDECRLVMENPEIRARLGEYKERFEKSEGFDVPEPPAGAFLCICPADWLEDPKLVAQSKFAVDEQNTIEGTKMELIKIVKAMEQLVSGVLYYLTIEVKDDGNLIICQAKTYKSFRDTTLQLFREVPRNWVVDLLAS